jgi:hypothetical protein
MDQRKTTAILLLQSLAREARSYRDLTVRARIQARLADALWQVDKDQARDLFRRAWDTADDAAIEADRRVVEERRAQITKYGNAAWANPPDFHAEILKLVEKHDEALGKEFLAKLDEPKQQETASVSNSAHNKLSEYLKPTVLSPAEAQKLGLAMRLLEAGNLAHALRVADPVLGRVSMEGVTFLSTLRDKNADAADQRYAALLISATIDPASDANTVSLLSSYAFTPFVYFTALSSGISGISQPRASCSPPALSAQLRASFFRAAAQILLRPMPQPDQDRTSAGRGELTSLLSDYFRSLSNMLQMLPRSCMRNRMP